MAEDKTLGIVDILNASQLIHNDRSMWSVKAIDQMIESAVKKATQHKKEASVSVKIYFKPDDLNRMQIMVIADSKEPKAGAIAMQAFTDSKGTLYEEDPQQTRLPLAELSARRA